MLDDNGAVLQQKTEQRDDDQTRIGQLEDRITEARSGQLSCSDDLHQAETGLTQVQTRRRTRA